MGRRKRGLPGNRMPRYDMNISSEDRTISPLDVSYDNLRIDSSARVTVTGTLTSLSRIRIDRDAKLVVQGNLTNIRHLEVDRGAELVVKGDITNCNHVEADRDGEIDVSGGVSNVSKLIADRRGDIFVGRTVNNSSEVSKRGGSIDVAIEDDEEESEEDGSDSLDERGYEENRLGDLENLSVDMPDEHLAVWVQCRIMGVEISGRDFEIMYQQYPELASILKQVNSVDKAIELSRKNANVEFTERQVEMMRKAEKAANRRAADDVIEAITEAVEAAELRREISTTNAYDDGDGGEDEEENESGMSVL